MVLGHEGCGAVKAALVATEQKERESPGIRQLVKRIEPALAGIDSTLPQSEQIHTAVEANVRLAMRRLLEYADHREEFEKGEFDIVGAVYELRTGKVRFLE